MSESAVLVSGRHISHKDSYAVTKLAAPKRQFVSVRVLLNAARTFRYANMDRKPRTFAVASSLANSRSYNSLTCTASRPVSRARASTMDVSCPDAGPPRSPAFIFRRPCDWTVDSMTIRFQTAFASILLHCNRTTGMNRHTFNAASPHSEAFLAFPCANLVPSIWKSQSYPQSRWITLCTIPVCNQNVRAIQPLTRLFKFCPATAVGAN